MIYSMHIYIMDVHSLCFVPCTAKFKAMHLDFIVLIRWKIHCMFILLL